MAVMTYEQFEHLVDALYAVDTGCGCCAPPAEKIKTEIRHVLMDRLGLRVETVLQRAGDQEGQQ